MKKPNRMFVAPAVDDGCRSDHHFWCRASHSSKTQVVVELNKSRCYFIELNKTKHKHPRPTPSDGRPCIRLGRFIEATPQGGQTGHHGDDDCGGSCVGPWWNFRTIPSVGNLRSGSFSFPLERFLLPPELFRTRIAVKLLMTKILHLRTQKGSLFLSLQKSMRSNWNLSLKVQDLMGFLLPLAGSITGFFFKHTIQVFLLSSIRAWGTL